MELNYLAAVAWLTSTVFTISRYEKTMEGLDRLDPERRYL